MEGDIFNEFMSDEGSPHLGRNIVIPACNEPESSNSPFFNPNSRIANEKRAQRISNDIYREKFRKLKKVAKGYVFVSNKLKIFLKLIFTNAGREY